MSSVILFNSVLDSLFYAYHECSAGIVAGNEISRSRCTPSNLDIFVVACVPILSVLCFLSLTALHHF